MKKTNKLLVKVFSTLFILHFASSAPAQTTSSQIVSLMKEMGWKASSIQVSTAMIEGEQNALSLYHFDSAYKYAIIAFSENFEVGDIQLEMKNRNGKRFKKDYDLYCFKKVFHLPYNCATLIFNPEKTLDLRIQICAKYLSTSAVVPDCTYLIFYR